MKRKRMCLAVVTLVLTGGAAAQDEVDPPASHIRLDETVISGNQELPKVL